MSQALHPTDNRVAPTPNHANVVDVTSLHESRLGKPNDLQAVTQTRGCFVLYLTRFVIPMPPHVVHGVEKGSSVNRKFALRCDVGCCRLRRYQDDEAKKLASITHPSDTSPASSLSGPLKVG